MNIAAHNPVIPCPNATDNPYSCPHHGEHYWQWGPDIVRRVPERLIPLIQSCAVEQLKTVCGTPGNVLTFEQIVPEVSSSLNWTVRRSAGWADEEELIVATCRS
jgi:hypothetical protein